MSKPDREESSEEDERRDATPGQPPAKKARLSSESAEESSKAAEPRTLAIFVKRVGASGYVLFEDLKEDILIGKLRKVLAQDDAFKDLHKVSTTLRLVRIGGEEEPTEQEEMAAVQLEGVGKSLASVDTAKARLLWMTASDAPDVLRDPTASAAAVHAAMHPEWRDTVARLVGERKAVNACAMLTRGKVDLADADVRKTLKLEALHQDPITQAVRLGVFEMPAIPRVIMEGPEGLPLDAPQLWFYEQQRAAISSEFLQAMQRTRPAGLPPYGVLLSGPNGAGKSAIGVEAALACFAQGLVCVYIPQASAWVEDAASGHGDGFLLHELLAQSADLIAAQPLLRKALARALVLDAKAVHEMDCTLAKSIMNDLRVVLKANPSIKIGIIVDEVQHVTTVVRNGMSGAATTGTTGKPCIAAAAEYFQQWHNWKSRNKVFTRMEIATNSGERELEPPLGEVHRLRIVKPWSAEVVHAATTAVGSPCAFAEDQEAARKHIVRIVAGGLPWYIFRSKELLTHYLAEYDAKDARDKAASGPRLEWATAFIEADFMSAMKGCCMKWFEALSAEEKDKASRSMLRLIRGEIPWTRIKALYDEGLVARCDEAPCVKPVSTLAASVIIAQLAPYCHEFGRKPLKEFGNGAERGYALEQQVIVSLAAVSEKSVSLSARTLKGDEDAPNVPGPVRANESLPFGCIDDIIAHASLSRLYVPTSKSFSCDAITVPAASTDASVPIVLWETSVTEPRDSGRIEKVLKWFRPVGIVTQLRAAHPGRDIVCALCWDKSYVAAGTRATKYVELTDAAAAASTAGGGGVRVAVVDATGLQALGVMV